MVGMLSFGCPIGWPSSVNTGYTRAPGYQGSLTAWPGGTGAKTLSNGTNATSGSGTALDPWIFSFFDFDGVASGTILSLSHAKFIGCRFQSNFVADYNVRITGADITLSYCSVTPRASLHAAPPNAAWPSASVGLQQVGNGTGYQISGNDGYQYGLQLDAITGPVTVDHCDIWGFGNALTWLGTSFACVINACWIHDAADAAAQGYHTDGPGYLNGGTPPSNISITNNTIASIGNTNGIAFQAATSGYSNITVTGNYMSGFGYLVDMCNNTAGNANLTFTDNILATDLPWVFGPIYADFTTQFTGGSNVWRRNKLKVYPGTSPVGGATFSFASGDDGKYVLPNQTLSAVDFAG